MGFLFCFVADTAGSGLRDLETEVVNCGNIFDTENICTHGMDLQKVIK